MGNDNVRAILLASPPITDLPPRTLHCLLLIALRAHDDTGLYYAGHSWLIMQLGYAQNEGGRQHVMAHIRLLKKAGYIADTGSNRGRKAVYQLRLPHPFPPVDN